MQRYKIVFGYTIGELEKKVQELMDDRTNGIMYEWTPQGAMTLGAKYYYQTMVLELLPNS